MKLKKKIGLGGRDLDQPIQCKNPNTSQTDTSLRLVALMICTKNQLLKFRSNEKAFQ